LARTDFRAAAARRLSEDRELSPAIVSLLSPDSPTRSVGVRIVPLDHIEPNPEQPRLAFNQETLDELAASIREHGVLQPILVRPVGPNQYQLIAGERRWRASQLAGLETIPALIEEIDDDTALEISIIENLQREDISPLDEAAMYDRMVREHGYSIRKLADKLGKDKGYLENRLRLADAPDDVRELVSLRKDTLSHAYELMKVEDPKKRRRLADQVARGELTLARLRDKIEGRRTRAPRVDDGVPASADVAVADDAGDEEVPEQPVAAVEVAAERTTEVAFAGWTGTAVPSAPAPGGPALTQLSEDSLVNAKHSLADALDELTSVLRTPEALESIGDVDRANLAKYLTIAKLRLENAIAIVRTGDID
jgi:ParB/RepB/Spo0J family partition protein